MGIHSAETRRKLMRDIIVCADDAGWDEANDEVISRHAHAGEISAVSVLVNGPTAPDWAEAGLGPSCAMGLHFSLTWAPESGSKGLGPLILAAFSGRISASWVEAQARAQLLRFESIYSRPPDFIDGHQHVQILPGIREPLLKLLEQRYGAGERPAMRVPRSHVRRGWKASVLNWLGARRLESELRARSWPANRDFAGAYDMSDDRQYRQQMQAWLKTISSGGLIMTHPGSSTLTEHGAARSAESAYLASSCWRQDMCGAEVRLIPFNRLALSAAELNTEQVAHH